MTKTADVANETASGLRELASQVPGKAAELKDSAIHGAENALDAIATQIKKHPVPALAIAFGLGFIAMRIARR